MLIYECEEFEPFNQEAFFNIYVEKLENGLYVGAVSIKKK